MVSVQQVLLAVLIFQVSVNGAPSDIAKLEDIAKVERDVKLDDKPNTLAEVAENNNKTTDQGQRQKRFYNYYGYGFPPMNPVIYPNYFNRDDTSNNGGYGYDDPFAQIYKRLQDIATVIRQPNVPPPHPLPPSQFPIFFPVIYIPQFDCVCTPDPYTPPDNQNKPTPPPQDNNDTSSDVGISNRFPDMEDERQNWGFVINETEEDDGLEDDFTRPISFDPISVNDTMSRPQPGVDHGSSQAGEGRDTTTTTTTRPRMENPPSTVAPPIAAAPPSSSVEAPSACDGAVLSCCHQPEVTYDCFAIQGCPDPTSFGNPCDTQVILRVIDRFQRFYGQRTG